MAAPQSSTTSDKSAKWDALKKKSNTFFQKVGKPFNALSHKLGAESFWPTDLGEESDKAARILRSFCLDGFKTDKQNTKDGKDDKVLQHIPAEVIRNAKGLAIFTTLRAGLQWSGAGGSGVIVEKMPNGQWSPPSGILVHTLGFGFLIGADIYDCVVVINNEKGMEGFTRVRATLGGEISAAVGPVGVGGTVDSEVLKRQTPVWTYTKSKGLYVGAQIDGTVILERDQENERFYHAPGVRHADILSGKVQPPPGTMTQLWETLQAAEGGKYNASNLPPPDQKSPSDFEGIAAPKEESHREYGDPADQYSAAVDHKA